MKQVYITRRARFNAAHKLWNPGWSDEKNIEVFGKCANVNWHGHNYDLHVTIKGVPHPDTGFCMNLSDLKELIRIRVEKPLDHRNLNLDVPWLAGKMTSTEILIIEIWEQLEEAISEKGSTLHKLRLYETENNYAEYYGGE
jgi:6-pyruvoyltetrahydropterin/6-carboxytetrahydropterin synthase|tara:strand:+ start:126 stop:548 length:423 start_codon:yes stop_codon:yes gene_type:complete